MTIAPELLRRIVEGALLAAGQPLSEERLLSLIDEGERPEKALLQEALQQIADSCGERGFTLRQVASGWRFQVPEDLAPWVNRLWEEKPQKYSRATLETLAIIAYRQPITRGDIEEIRGVAVSTHIVKTLAERGWVKVVGHRDVPGKPSLYATTREFLDYFNLRTLDDLPTLAEIRDIDSLNQVLDLDGQFGAALAQGEDDSAEEGLVEEEISGEKLAEAANPEEEENPEEAESLKEEESPEEARSSAETEFDEELSADDPVHREETRSEEVIHTAEFPAADDAAADESTSELQLAESQEPETLIS
jgi:segregation and condensation protein B